MLNVCTANTRADKIETIEKMFARNKRVDLSRRHTEYRCRDVKRSARGFSQTCASRSASHRHGVVSQQTYESAHLARVVADISASLAIYNVDACYMHLCFLQRCPGSAFKPDTFPFETISGGSVGG